MSVQFVYPESARSVRQRIGGALYLVLGLVFLVLAFVASDDANPDWMWLFAAATAFVVGTVAAGYRHDVRIDPGTGLIRSYTGFLFIGKHRRCSVGDFGGIEIRRSTQVGTRFAKFSNRTYEPTVEVTYQVVLQGRQPLEVETTGQRELADKWANEIGQALKLPVSFVDEDKIETPQKAQERKIDKWVAVGALIAALATFVWIFYNLMQIG